MDDKKTKTMSNSLVESWYLVMPNHANQYGTAFGGTIVAWMDIVASMAAQKHCGKEVVTASIDSLSFDEPIYIGDQVLIQAFVSYVGRTSMEVSVKVYRHSTAGDTQKQATKAFLTFVALDKNKKPTTVTGLLLETDEEKSQYEISKKRAESRKERLKQGS